MRRPVIAPRAPERYRVQFTIGQEAYDTLREMQRLLRREIPDGDPGAIFERALALLRKDVEKKKLGLTSKPRPARIGSRTSSTLPATTVDGRYIFGPYGASIVREGRESADRDLSRAIRRIDSSRLLQET